MKASQKVLIYTEGIALIFILAACNLPIRSPTAFVFPTVDLTQTTVFNPTIPPPVTETPSTLTAATSTVINNTAVPSATVLPPAATATLLPQPSATSVPPTNTPLPPTPTIPVARSSPLAVAPFLSKAPTIDGSWNDLPSSSEKPANIQVYRNPAYTGDAKPGMSYRIAWDNNYLYIGVKVGDANYNQPSTGENIYKGDSVEVLIDTNVSGDFYVHSLSADDYQLGISPGYVKIGNKPEAYLWFPAGKAGSRSDVKIAAINPSAGLFRIEFAIPWKLLGITPTAGMHLGFVISYSDNATDSKAEQDLMISNDPNRVLTDPTTWGDLTLTN
jgi:archaellum component FlaG (FlaF/FlaG flagellin family)